MMEPLLGKRKNCRRVADFYDGKSIFITGAAGFVGVVLLETLLRCCVGIRTIFILIREKKGESPEVRKENLFKRKIFSRLRNENPQVFEKVRVVAGDVSKPHMAISDEDLQSIIEEVSILFHCAASISFSKPFSFLLQQNLVGTNNVLQLCKKLNKIDVLVYTSTIFSNSNYPHIEERIYKMKYPPQKFLEEMKLGNTDVIDAMFNNNIPPYPNYYCMSKCITENLLQEYSSEFPIGIVRPSMVCMNWKGAMPGYAEENSNLAQLCLGFGKGFIKVLTAKPDVDMPLIPADIVANAHIVMAWKLASKRLSPLLVLNCTLYDDSVPKIKDFDRIARDFASKNFIPNTLRSNSYIFITNNDVISWIVCMIEHYIPAYGLDLILRMQGKKPKLVKLYKFLDVAMETSRPFTTANWIMDTQNFRNLEDNICEEDKQDFYTDTRPVRFEDLLRNVRHGAPFFDWSLDKKSPTERMRIAKQVYVITRVIQVAFFVCVFGLIYLMYSVIFG